MIMKNKEMLRMMKNYDGDQEKENGDDDKENDEEKEDVEEEELRWKCNKRSCSNIKEDIV